MKKKHAKQYYSHVGEWNRYPLYLKLRKCNNHAIRIFFFSPSPRKVVRKKRQYVYLWVKKADFLFLCLGFLSRTFTINRTTGEGGRYFFLNPLYHFQTLHGRLYISKEIAAGGSPLRIATLLALAYIRKYLNLTWWTTWNIYFKWIDKGRKDSYTKRHFPDSCWHLFSSQNC